VCYQRCYILAPLTRLGDSHFHLPCKSTPARSPFHSQCKHGWRGSRSSFTLHGILRLQNYISVCSTNKIDIFHGTTLALVNLTFYANVDIMNLELVIMNFRMCNNPTHSGILYSSFYDKSQKIYILFHAHCIWRRAVEAQAGNCEHDQTVFCLVWSEVSQMFPNARSYIKTLLSSSIVFSCGGKIC
jgi:hypothetical protein